MREASCATGRYYPGMKNPKDNPSPQTKVRWYLQEWREKLDLTQAQLAEMLHTSAGMISEHEAGTRRFNDDWMARWAHALKIHPIDLLRNPDEVDALRKAEDKEAAELLAKLPEGRKEEALRFLHYLASQSPDR